MKRFLKLLEKEINLEVPYQNNKFIVAVTVADVLEKVDKTFTRKKRKAFLKRCGAAIWPLDIVLTNWYTLDMDETTLQLIKDAYKVLANCQNQWAGRHTGEGQKLLCRLRDTIAEATNQHPKDVQDSVQC